MSHEDGDEVEYIRDELHKAEKHVRNAINIAENNGWQNDELSAMMVLADCADSINKSINKRSRQAAEDYDIEDEVLFLMSWNDR